MAHLKFKVLCLIHKWKRVTYNNTQLIAFEDGEFRRFAIHEYGYICKHCGKHKIERIF